MLVGLTIKRYLSPRLTRGRKRTGLINQIFIQSVFMRSRVKRGNKIVLTPSFPHFLVTTTRFVGSKCSLR